MLCAGCDKSMLSPLTAAFAIMKDEDGEFEARPVCSECFTDPSHRVRVLKAHFALPGDVDRMLIHAGSSSIG